MIYIGELYNHELLTDKIINSCFTMIFVKGLKNAQIVYILCSLMQTVGEKFSQRCPSDCKKWFSKIDEVKDDDALGLKESFALMDLIDLKNNKQWIK